MYLTPTLKCATSEPEEDLPCFPNTVLIPRQLVAIPFYLSLPISPILGNGRRRIQPGDTSDAVGRLG